MLSIGVISLPKLGAKANYDGRVKLIDYSFQSQAEEELGKMRADLLHAQTIANIATLIEHRSATRSDAGDMGNTTVVEEETTGKFNLTSIQQFCANYALRDIDYLSVQSNKHFNHSFCLQPTSLASTSRL